ncbi:hypothetical protein N7G274_009711 [Stereocaulon virgatum]|uniref:Uncharacterized protein n=1 Tax=Stereocaulon virgatum TaxID=373712 RepID=A0ABR4A2N2_9LECA
MKSSVIHYFAFWRLVCSTITLAARIPPCSTALIHRLSHTTTLLHNNTMPFSHNVRPPDPTYYGYGRIRGPDSGVIKIYDYGPELFFTDQCEVSLYIVAECEYHISRGPDVRLGPDQRFWTYGSVSVTLRPWHYMTWRKWCAAYEQLIIENLDFQLRFEITGFRIGIIGMGEVEKIQ